MTRQFVATHTIRYTDIPAPLNSRVKNTPSIKMLHKKNLVLIFSPKHNTLKCWPTEGPSSFLCLL